MRWVHGIVALALLAGCLQDPSDPHVIAEKLHDFDRRERALDHLANLPLERARLAIPEMIELYRETAEAGHLRALTRFDDPRVHALLLEALDRWQLDRARALVAVRAFADWKTPAARGKLQSIAALPLPRSDPNNEVRVEALRALLRIGDAGMVPTLIELLSTPLDRQDFRLHQQAAAGLASFPDPAAVPALIRGLSLSWGKANTFEECRLALARIGPPAVPALLALFGPEAPPVRPARRRQVAVIDTTVPATRVHAARLLGDLRAVEATPRLAAALRPLRTATPFALALVRALGLIGTSEAVDPLLSVVRDPGAAIELRVAAAEAAASTGDEFVAPVLLDLVAGGANPRDQTPPWLRTQLLRPLVRVIDAERAGELRALPHDPRMLDSDAQAQVVVAETCKADLDCYARLLDDPLPARAEKAAWAIAFSGDGARAPALLATLGRLSELPAARYGVYSAALAGLTRLADQSCQTCRDKLRAQIAIDAKMVHDAREKELFRETRLALAYLDHKTPPAAPTPTARR